MRGKMNMKSAIVLCVVCLAGWQGLSYAEQTKPAAELDDFTTELPSHRQMRMDWWQQARFGLFIHWGLYAVPAGRWQGKTGHGEWIRHEAQIPSDQYDLFAGAFNPQEFSAAQWVGTAKAAGFKYIIITSKHHDGFCLWDSAQTKFDIMDATHYKRDILKLLADECRKQDMKLGFYYSIMDWHYPDYLPRRNWETRSADGADFERYVAYMKGQLKEIVQQYDPAVLWFDGEWEGTWTEERGKDLYNYVRELKPDIIINNRVGKGRKGMSGTYDPNTAVGDFGTPEQEIPATGLPYDWETCMTTNDHWGYNAADLNYKSAQDLIRKLADTASKGGNFLLNVGPTAEGIFPPEAIQRLQAIGRWMQMHGDSIYATQASLFRQLSFGRSTTGDKRIYLFIFDWPDDGKLTLPGLVSRPLSVHFMNYPDLPVGITMEETDVVLSVPQETVESPLPVIELEFAETPQVANGPEIYPVQAEFEKAVDISFSDFVADDSHRIHYTLDGNDPNQASLYYEEPFTLRNSATVSCRKFSRDGKPLSAVSRKQYIKKTPAVPAKKEK